MQLLQLLLSFFAKLCDFQLIFYKENSPHYDAGIAVDDVRFYDCPLPRPTADDECPTEEWRCSNKVLYMLIS